jgi:hypothetical protein
MASPLLKTLLILAVVLCAFAQDGFSNQGSRSFPNADPSWGNYQVKSCCPKGYFEVYNYCVKCTLPLVFDPIDNKCKPCIEGQTYNPVSGRCECFKCLAPRETNPVTNNCECKTAKGTQLIYVQATN